MQHADTAGVSGDPVTVQPSRSDHGALNGAIAPSRLRLSEVIRVGLGSLAARKLRSVLSALGIAIGIASLVSVLGLSDSSKSALLDQIGALGTNLVPEDRTGGISVFATDPGLMGTLNGSVADGAFITEATRAHPVAVVGAVAAERLGIRDLDTPVELYLGERWVEVLGILEPFALAADLDRAVLIGDRAAETYYDIELAPTVIYVRVDEDHIDATRDVLAGTIDPENPEEVEISRPSDLLEARSAAESSFTGLFLGLGAVALLVGGIGVANVMVIGVIERRGEIGLRRAIGATRAHIRRQFLTEALTLASLGGAVGVLMGVAVTYVYATAQGWRVIIPTVALAGGIAAAVAIGAVAGLYPAIRAARVSPTEALRSD
ncbi:MAG: ABC transporter permease [Acidimicrobiaceae bacterium]|nr:ABC transporter permease [Acidimicrobiaceae bacterium]